MGKNCELGIALAMYISGVRVLGAPNVEIVSCCLLTVLTNFNMTLSCFQPDNQDVKLNPMYLTYRYIFLSFCGF
jgi:hypothetical protein